MSTQPDNVTLWRLASSPQNSPPEYWDRIIPQILQISISPSLQKVLTIGAMPMLTPDVAHNKMSGD
jgi:hypothetical protein